MNESIEQLEPATNEPSEPKQVRHSDMYIKYSPLIEQVWIECIGNVTLVAEKLAETGKGSPKAPTIYEWIRKNQDLKDKLDLLAPAVQSEVESMYIKMDLSDDKNFLLPPQE